MHHGPTLYATRTAGWRGPADVLMGRRPHNTLRLNNSREPSVHHTPYRQGPTKPLLDACKVLSATSCPRPPRRRLTGLLSAYLALIQVLVPARLPRMEQLLGFDHLTA